MSDTPRTDTAKWHTREPGNPLGADVVYASFAEGLERELTAAKDTISHFESQMGRLQDQRDGYRAGAERLKAEIGIAYKEGWTEGFACDGHAVYGFEGQRDADFEKSRAKRLMEGKE